MMRRLGEGMALLFAGLFVGWFAVSVAPGTAGPMIAGAVVLALGGRFMFDGTFNWLGFGLVISAAVTLGIYVRDFADVGGA
jgi:hypothetical protein